jgi:GTP-binding protein HflX
VSAGHEPARRVVCHRPRPDPGLYLGRGKADEIAAAIAETDAQLVLFDHEISAVQQRNLERLWNVRVLDRTELILDIFGQRARSTEGKLQVELARLQHQSSRLVRAWSHLERQRGGIGVRGGPGETQLEMDRRMLAARIRQVRERLDRTERQRRTRRRARDRREAFRVSLVGYTNAGKSTLFNAITGAGTYAADQLFATLDTLTRRVVVAPGVELALSDTVGFVRDLPHQLVAAFRATLEETAEADLLLHVVDASAPDRAEQVEQVDRVLAEIGAERVPQWLVMNKIDAVPLQPEVQLDGCGNIERLSVSARTGSGLDALREALRVAVIHARPGRADRDERVDAIDRRAPARGGKDDGSEHDDTGDAGTSERIGALSDTEQHLPNGMPDVDPHSHSVVAQ